MCFMIFWIIYLVDFLDFYNHLIGKMDATPRDVDVLKVEQTVVFFLGIYIYMIYCNLQYQPCNKDVSF